MPATLGCCISLIGLLALASAVPTGIQYELMARVPRSTTTDVGASTHVNSSCPSGPIDEQLRKCEDVRQHICSTAQNIAIKAIYDAYLTAGCLQNTLRRSRPSVNLTSIYSLNKFKFFINDTWGNLTSSTYAKMLRIARPFFDLLHPVEKSETNLMVELNFLKLRLREFVNSLDVMIECDENMTKTDGSAKIDTKDVLKRLTEESERLNYHNRQFRVSETPQTEVNQLKI
jgi:hypothetical protein